MEIIKIGKYDVSKVDIWEYINHFGKEKADIFAWDRVRKALHEIIFTKQNIVRTSDEGQEFSKQLDEFCIPHMEKFDAIAVRAKELSNAKTEQEIKHAQTMLEVAMYKKNYQAEQGFRGFKLDDKTGCRVCGKEQVKGIAFAQDHLATVFGQDKINQPICMDCSRDNPDEYHIAFKKQYWSKK